MSQDLAIKIKKFVDIFPRFSVHRFMALENWDVQEIKGLLLPNYCVRVSINEDDNVIMRVSKIPFIYFNYESHCQKTSQILPCVTYDRELFEPPQETKVNVFLRLLKSENTINQVDIDVRIGRIYWRYLYGCRLDAELKALVILEYSENPYAVPKLQSDLLDAAFGPKWRDFIYFTMELKREEISTFTLTTKTKL